MYIVHCIQHIQYCFLESDPDINFMFVSSLKFQSFFYPCMYYFVMCDLVIIKLTHAYTCILSEKNN